jgi:predicted RNase H-like HicB family nuclease
VKLHYTVVVKWSTEDKTYVVFLPEWEGLVGQPCTDGKTYKQAAKHGRQVLEMLVKGNKEEGKPLPAPQPYMGGD